MYELHIEVECLKTNPETGLLALDMETYAVFFTVEYAKRHPSFSPQEHPEIEVERIVNLETKVEVDWKDVFSVDYNQKSPKKYDWGKFCGRAVDVFMRRTFDDVDID